jgi:hypothetical protein
MRAWTDCKLVERFSAAVIEQNRCIERGDAASGNRAARQYISAARELLRRGEQAVDAFSALFSHVDAGVRVMAAAYLLESRTEAAVAVLQHAAGGTGLAAFGAAMTLKRYERGELRIVD